MKSSCKDTLNEIYSYNLRHYPVHGAKLSAVNNDLHFARFTGQVYAWGSNKLGQLGIFDLKTQKSTEPVLVKFFKESVTVLRTRGFENIICSSSGRIIKFGCDPNKMQSYITRSIIFTRNM